MYEEPTSRRRNREVADLLQEIGDLLEIKGEQRYRINAYRNAARRIESLTEPIETLFAERRLREIPGVGEALEQKITEFLATGRLEYIERLRGQFPPSLVALLDVPGLGPRKARLVFDQLGVANLEQLEQAARAHRLTEIPGLGDKTEENLLQELQRLKQRSRRRMLDWALGRAQEIEREVERHPGVKRVGHAGSLRRMQETIGDVDILAVAEDAVSVSRHFQALPQVVDVLSGGPARTTVLISGGLQVDLKIVPAESWGAAMQYFTGSKAHNIRLREMAVRRGWKLNEYGLFDARTDERLAGDDEDEIYRKLDLAPIPPELREDTGEIEAAQAGRLPQLLAEDDIEADFHLHTNWTDGAHTLEEMARAAIALGRSYMAVTDHSRSLYVARGLTIEQLVEQRELADQLNKKLAPFRILLGTEMDILADGTLDYPDEVLAQLDYVSISIHSAMKQPREEMTARILRAMENPYVATLNHPHGRLLEQRDPIEVDMGAVVDAAARLGVALELNSQPHRMDLNDRWARRAIDAGARLMINTDAHTTSQLGLMRYGVAMARRGWAEPRHVLNALPLEGILEHLSTRRPA